MRWLRLLLGLVLVSALHLVLLRLSPGVARALDLHTVLVVLVALEGGPMVGLVGGAIIGLGEDALVGSLYGLHGFANTIIGFLAARLARWVQTQQTSVLGLFFAAGVALKAAVMAGLLLVVAPQLQLFRAFEVVVRVAASAAFGLLALLLTEHLRSRFGFWRSSRRRRVKLD